MQLFNYHCLPSFLAVFRPLIKITFIRLSRIYPPPRRVLFWFTPPFWSAYFGKRLALCLYYPACSPRLQCRKSVIFGQFSCSFRPVWPVKEIAAGVPLISPYFLQLSCSDLKSLIFCGFPSLPVGGKCSFNSPLFRSQYMRARPPRQAGGKPRYKAFYSLIIPYAILNSPKSLYL